LFPKTFVKKKDRLRQWIEIDRTALVHNLHQFQKLIGRDGREIITAEHLAFPGDPGRTRLGAGQMAAKRLSAMLG
jgi:hypothetical protein